MKRKSFKVTIHLPISQLGCQHSPQDIPSIQEQHQGVSDLQW